MNGEPILPRWAGVPAALALLLFCLAIMVLGILGVASAVIGALGERYFGGAAFWNF